MKKTFRELHELDMTVGAMYKATPALENTKFGYAFRRFIKKNYLDALEQFQAALAAVQIDNALEDPKTKALLTDPTNPGRPFQYSKDGLKKCIADEKAVIEEWNAKEYDVEPFISAYVPENLTDEQREVLAGLLIAA